MEQKCHVVGPHRGRRHSGCIFSKPDISFRGWHVSVSHTWPAISSCMWKSRTLNSAMYKFPTVILIIYHYKYHRYNSTQDSIFCQRIWQIPSLCPLLCWQSICHDCILFFCLSQAWNWSILLNRHFCLLDLFLLQM